MAEAQTYANNGYFVVAGYINPIPNKSGHVVVIVPGSMQMSSTWKCAVPCTMDTGRNKRDNSTTLSQSFGPDKKGKINFYIYEST